MPRTPESEGRFGRLFPHLPPFLPPDKALESLAAQMHEPPSVPGEEDGFDNPDIAAGFTYFGQFIDHDLTFDPTSLLGRVNDPDALEDFRTPRFDLDSVYGRSPDDEPFLYDKDSVHLLIGRNAAGEEDLPRNANGAALLGDPLNDENEILSQLTLGILKYHNHVVDVLPADVPCDDRFREANRIVRWHYQWAVIHDFLETVLCVTKVPRGPRLPRWWRRHPFMPVEFSVGAYRFGHSMVRGEYELNDAVQDVPIFAQDPTPDLRGGRERPPGHVIQWARFFEFPESSLDTQRSRKIDTKLAFGLSILPDVVIPGEIRGIYDLAERDLKRGKALGLPSGQAIARALGIPEKDILTGDALGPLPPGLRKVFGTHTPLFFYVPKEAEALNGGRHLGPVGGRIVVEVFLALLHADPASYVRVEPNFRPKAGQFGAPQDGVFRMVDLLRFAGVTIG